MNAPAFARALLRWYDRERRDLPWRRAPGAYATLVSEFMLQQTVMATVIPYFDRFLARFPDFAALAAAPEEEVLALWSGLGYYARARNLHRAARAVVERGGLPEDEESLRALPGVGEYTAAVLAAIVLGQRTFALDGNAARVVARLFAEARPIDVPAVRVSLRAQGQTLVPGDRPGDFAQAVMELGALVCAPSAPRCDGCPVSRFCEAHARGRTGELPLRTPRAEKRKVAIACVAVERGGSVLLVKRGAGLLAGTWALPSVEALKGESDEAACARALAALGLLPSGAVQRAGTVRHIFTHRDLTARVLRAAATGKMRGEGRWVSPVELSGLGLSSFARKTLRLVQG
jgi:A/G-specific adenine glycosylase